MTDGKRATFFRRWFRPQLLIPVLAFITLAGWSVASPVGSSPDDDFHLASIWCAVGERDDACAEPSEASQRVVPTDVVESSACYAFKPAQSAACQGPNFGESPDDTRATDRGNFEGLYPPVYYWAMSVFVGPNVEISVVLMRLLNSAIFIGMVSAVFALLPQRRRATLVWPLIATTVPLGLFLIASTNPSGWAILSAGTLWISLLGYFETQGWRKAGLGALAVLSTLMGAGARADAAVYAGVAIVVVLILAAHRSWSFVRSAILPAALLVIAVLFYLTAGQAEASSTGLAPNAPSQDFAAWRALLTINILNVPDLWVGVFGRWGLGWLDTALPAVVWVASFAAFCAVIFVGMGSRYPRKWLAAGVVFASVWAVPTILLMQTQAVVGSYMQPRYILPLIVMLAGVLLLRERAGRVRLSPMQMIVFGTALAVAHAIALHTNLRRYITGSDVVGWNLNHGIEWWWGGPISPMLVWIAASLAFAGVVALACVALSRGTLFVGPRRNGSDGSDGAVVGEPTEAIPAGQTEASRTAAV